MKFLTVIGVTVLSAFTLFLITKVIGRKQLSQLDLFDYVTGITIGSIAAELATELEEPFRPFLSLLIWAAISVSLSVIGNKYIKSRKIINGQPIVLMKGGKIIRDNFAKCKMDLSEFLMMARQGGYFDLSELDSAVCEYNGKVSFLPKSVKKPVCPEDMKISVSDTGIYKAIIMDGEIMPKALAGLGFDEIWLSRQLDEGKHPKTEDVFLCMCDENGNLEVYPR